MKRYIALFLALTLIFVMLCGCSENSSGGASSDELYTVAVDDDGNTVVYDNEGDVVATTEDGDEIEVNDDGEIVIKNSNGSVTTLPANSTKNNTSEGGSSANETSSSEHSASSELSQNESASSVPTDENAPTEPNPGEDNSDMDIENITSGGTYTLSKTLTDTVITIDAPGEEVTVILSGATIKNSSGPAIYVREAGKVTLTLASGTTNYISDGASYSITDSGSIIDGAVFSKADLKINGSGTLVLNGNCKHGIVSKDDLSVHSGTLKVTARNVGLNGKDCVKIKGGNITINAGSDGIRSNNAVDSSRGYVSLSGGTVNITSGNDAVQAETSIEVSGVSLTANAGLSSTQTAYKGLKAGTNITVNSGNVNLKMPGDGIDAKGSITINGGNIRVSGADSAKASIIKYGTSAVVNGGTFIGVGAYSAAKNFCAGSKQGAMLVNTGSHSAGETVRLTDSAGAVLAEYIAAQGFSCILLSLPSLSAGGTYTLTAGSVSQNITMSGLIYG